MNDNRLDNNRQIVRMLSKLVEENPELRFGQILAGWKFVCQRNSWKQTPTTSTHKASWVDEFYIESSDILERVTNKIKATKDE